MGKQNSKFSLNSSQEDVTMKDLTSNEDFLQIRKKSYDRGNSSSFTGDAMTANRLNANQSSKKDIDKEHVTIERIFRVSLEESEKFLYLELYHAQLMSQDIEVAFRMKDLDEIMINIINDSDRKSIILPYLLETYHRAVEMIEKRFKMEFDSRYKHIRKVISNYVTLIINCADNFDVKLSKKEIHSHLSKYFKETDEEELGFFLMDLYNSTNNDLPLLSSVFAYLFNIIHEENKESKSHFFNQEKIKKNLYILISLFEQCPLAATVYVQEAKFNPILAGNSHMNGKNFQLESYLGPYLDVAVFEAEITSLKGNFPANKSSNEVELVVKNYTHRLNEYMNDLLAFVYSIYNVNNETKTAIFNWIYTLINSNFDRTKMYQNFLSSTTIGFLLNCLCLLMKIFFDLHTTNFNLQSISIFKIIAEVDPLFTLSRNNINFSKYDRVNADLAKEIINNEDEEYNYKEFNLTTRLFFTIHAMINLSVKSFDDEVGRDSQKHDVMIQENKTSDPLFKEIDAKLKAARCYLRNNEFNTHLMKFSEISADFLFCLNNKKYPQISLNDAHRNFPLDYTTFTNDFYDYVDESDNFALSLLPLFVPKNLYQIPLYIRKVHPDVLITELTSTKILVYFAIIYSSKTELIQNPHLRSEIFDILIYLFLTNSHEKNQKIYSISKLLNEDYVKKNLIYTVMKVFIDAERLGTSNQFYEKFSIRHKILYLIDTVMKANKNLFTQKIVEYANEFKEECTKMINLLMNDLTFLNDESIERLMDIKRYQDLIDDVEKFKNLDEETKKFEEKKFKENDHRIKTELKLFNSSLEFMVMISKTCTDNFMNYKLGERLSNLLNYSLDLFTSERGLKLKVKNMSEYGFDPKFVLKSLVSTYISFINYKEFMEYIVTDERSYKIANFEKVLRIYQRGKIKIVYEELVKFEKMIEMLKEIENEIKSNKINYDDAPEEYLDPITTQIMNDPVMLPSSRVIVDRSTIETHLLSDSSDPFNRTKLAKEMLISVDDLKEKIAEYKKLKNCQLQNKLLTLDK